MTDEMVVFSCECGIGGMIHCTREEAKEFKCPRCSLPIGRPLTNDDLMALVAKNLAKERRKWR